jgi:hypothetical protein
VCSTHTTGIQSTASVSSPKQQRLFSKDEPHQEDDESSPKNDKN